MTDDERERAAERMLATTITVNHPETTVELTYTGEGWRLWWTDHVANDFEETFPQLSVAVLRLAVLMACAEGDWYPTFTTGPPEFFRDGADFLVAAKAFFDATLDPGDH